MAAMITIAYISEYVTFWGLSYIIGVDGVSYIFGGKGLS